MFSIHSLSTALLLPLLLATATPLANPDPVPAHPGLMPPVAITIPHVFPSHREPQCVHICDSGVYRAGGCNPADVDAAREWCNSESVGGGGLGGTQEWFCCECTMCQGARQTKYPVTTIRRTTCKEEPWRFEQAQNMAQAAMGFVG